MIRIALIFLLCLPVTAAAQMLTPVVVARNGQDAPGVAGATFSTIQILPRLGTNGHVAFQSFMAGAGSNDVGFWAGTPGNLQLVMRENNVTGGPILFSSNDNLGVDSSGRVSMWARANSASNMDDHLFSYLPDGAQTLVAAEGVTVAPDFGGGVFSGIGAGQAANDSGAVAFVASVTGGDTTAASDQGLFAGTPGDLQLVAREGSTATGATGTAPVFSTTFTPIFDKRINSSGQVAFGAALSGVPAGADRAIYVWSPGGGGTLALAAQTGNTAPGMGSPTIRFSVVDDSPGFNDAGEVAFRGKVIGDPGDGVTLTNDFAIWAGAPGDVQLIARSGTDSPIAGVQYRAPDSAPRINDSGEVVFATLVAGSGVTTDNDRVLWLSTSSGVEIVAREGDHAPGTGAGVNFSLIEPTAGFVAPPAINAAGQVAFTATLTGAGVSGTNDRGLWAGAPGNVSLIAREGEVVDLDPGAGELLRTIQSISFANDYTVSGGTNFSSASAAFNDAGQIAWQAQFTTLSGGGTAVFLTTLPSIEPPSLDGDYNDDGTVDAADYVVWRKNEGTMTTLPNDPHGGMIGDDQYNTWVANFGETAGSGGGALTAVPEPFSLPLLLAAIPGIALILRRRKREQKRGPQA
jgi:hypothetical protein